MPDNYDNFYRFRSSSQVLLYTMLRGRRVRVKFSLLFDGVSHFNTSDALLAQKIRETEQYKSGRIIEDEPSPHEKPETEEETITETKSPKKTPSWMMSSMSMDQPKANKEAAKKAEAEALSQGESTRDQKPVQEQSATGSLFDLKAEDVDSYMAAKEYLREVVGAEASQIKNKSLMQQYCKDNSITFPNYEFD